MIVVCSQCGTLNQVPAERIGHGPNCGQCKSALLPDHPIELTDASFERFIAKNELPVVVDFWAAWCGPCRTMAPHFAEAASQMRGRALFAKLDTDAAPTVSARLGIRSIPTVAIFHAGRELTREAGARPAGEIVRWVEGEID